MYLLNGREYSYFQSKPEARPVTPAALPSTPWGLLGSRAKSPETGARGASSVHGTDGRTVTEALSSFLVHASRRGKQRWCVKGLRVAEKARASLQPAGSTPRGPSWGFQQLLRSQGGRAPGGRGGGEPAQPASWRGVAQSRAQSGLLPRAEVWTGSEPLQPLLHIYGNSATSTFPPPPVTGEVTLL